MKPAYPQGNHHQAQDAGNHNGAPTSPALRKVAEECSTDNRADVVDDSDHGRADYVQLELGLQKQREVVLRAMREAVEGRHQNDQVDENDWTAFNCIPHAAPDRDAASLPDGLALLPHRRLGNVGADKHYQQSRNDTYDEHHTPACIGEKEENPEVRNSGQQVATGIALLENT